MTVSVSRGGRDYCVIVLWRSLGLGEFNDGYSVEKDEVLQYYLRGYFIP